MSKENESCPVTVSESLLNEVIRIYEQIDPGPEVDVIALGRRLPNVRGASNLGIFEATVRDQNGQLIQNALVKIAKNGLRYQFIHAVSQLNLGMKYYGWTRFAEGDRRLPFRSTSELESIIISKEQGVPEEDPRYFKYFNDHTLEMLEHVAMLFINVGLVTPSFDYLIDETGTIRLIDYDLIYLSNEWSYSDIYTTADAIDRLTSFFILNLGEKWEEKLLLFRQKTMERLIMVWCDETIGRVLTDRPLCR